MTSRLVPELSHQWHVEDLTEGCIAVHAAEAATLVTSEVYLLLLHSRGGLPYFSARSWS